MKKVPVPRKLTLDKSTSGEQVLFILVYFFSYNSLIEASLSQVLRHP